MDILNNAGGHWHCARSFLDGNFLIFLKVFFHEELTMLEVKIV